MTRSLKPNNIFGQRKMSFLIGSIFLFFVGLMFTSCTKTPSQLGATLLPDSTLQILFSDTSAIVTYSVPIDTTRSDQLAASNLGSVSDPVFGETQASIYTKFIQPAGGQRFGDHPKLDSLVLQLAYAGVYGDSTTHLKLHVYELMQDIVYDSTSSYYSNQTVAVMPTDYADYSFQPQPAHQAIVNLDTIKGVVRIRLSDISNELGYKLLNADSTIMDSAQLFMGYFKGLYLTTDVNTQGGALASFSMNAPTTLLTVYYSNDAADSLQYSYIISSSMALVSNYKHDYSSGSQSFIDQVVDKDTTLGEKQFYVQGLAGVKTIIRFPNIKKLARSGKIAVNEAELILPGLENQPFLGAPAKLSLIRIVSDSSYAILPDENEGAAYFGGIYNDSTNEYQFRITHYIQSLIQDTTQVDKGLVLFVNNGAIQPQRFIFVGPHPSDGTLVRTKLNLLYTKLK